MNFEQMESEKFMISVNLKFITILPGGFSTEWD